MISQINKMLNSILKHCKEFYILQKYYLSQGLNLEPTCLAETGNSNGIYELKM